MAALGRRAGAFPTPSRSTALIDSWRTTADGAGSETALGAALHARSVAPLFSTRAIYTRLLFRGGNLKHAYPRGCRSTARPPLRVTHYGPTTFCRPELRVPHAVVVTVREEGRPPSRGQLSLSRARRLLSRLASVRSCGRIAYNVTAASRSSPLLAFASRSSPPGTRYTSSRVNVVRACARARTRDRSETSARAGPVRIRARHPRKGGNRGERSVSQDNAAGVVATPPSHRVRHARLRRRSPEHPRGASVRLTVPRR